MKLFVVHQKWLSFFKISLIVAGIFTSVSWGDVTIDQQQKVLVLHSYHQGLEWTDGITRGIKEVFKDAEDDYSLHFDYLDTKRTFSDDYFQKLTELYSKKTRLIEYKAIIISDNNALNFYLGNSDLFEDNTPVIFCGINNYDPSMLDGFSNVTGVAEKTDLEGTIDLMLELHPHVKRIVIVNDKTPTGLAVRRELDALVPEYQNRVSILFLDSIDLQNLHESLGVLGKNDLLYLLSCNRDSKGRFLSYKYSAYLMRQSTDVPIYGSWDFYLGKGIVGGKIISGYEQGKTAARMTLRVLGGEPIADIPVISDPISKFYFDYNELVRVGIGMNEIPKESVIINQPHRYTSWERYLLYGVSLILVVTFIIHFLTSKQSSRREEKLRKEKDKLDEHVRVRTEKLQASYTQLEQEIEVRTKAEKLLRESNETKDKFFSIIAHDLKNPFGGIVSLTDLLDSNWREYTDDERDKMLSELSKQSKATYQLLQDLLTWARLKQETIRPVLKELSPVKILDECLAVLNSNILSKRISVIVDADRSITILSDPFILSTILNNLLGNAVKFTPSGGKITIVIAVESEQLLISVRDNGIGMDPETIDCLFQSISNKSTPGTNNEYGTGLGLVICKQFTKLLSGDLFVESAGKDMGALVRVLLPFQALSKSPITRDK